MLHAVKSSTNRITGKVLRVIMRLSYFTLSRSVHVTDRSIIRPTYGQMEKCYQQRSEIYNPCPIRQN